MKTGRARVAGDFGNEKQEPSGVSAPGGPPHFRSVDSS